MAHTATAGQKHGQGHLAISHSSAVRQEVFVGSAHVALAKTTLGVRESLGNRLGKPSDSALVSCQSSWPTEPIGGGFGNPLLSAGGPPSLSRGGGAVVTLCSELPAAPERLGSLQ